MLFGETVALCSENHTKPTSNTLWGQTAKVNMLKEVVYIVTGRSRFDPRWIQKGFFL
jgi:hypothetical protein